MEKLYQDHLHPILALPETTFLVRESNLGRNLRRREQRAIRTAYVIAIRNFYRVYIN